MRYVAFLFIVLPLAFAAAPGTTETSERPQGRYLLGPQDRLMVRVHSLRRNIGEAYAWVSLNGEFAVGADGTVSMPIVGHVRAAGGTTAELADQISRRLKETANLADLPSASVEVIQHRPFFVLGAVQQPGKYEFQLGMTVLQALSIAQGLARAADLTGVERDMIEAGGGFRTLAAERIALEAKQARLSAEIAGADDISYRDDLTARIGDPRVALARREETLRFSTRRDALRAELEAIEQSKLLLQQELKSLEDKGKSLDRQLELNKRELRIVSDLVSRGLTVTPRQLAAENTQVNIESNRLDVQVSTLRAHQSLTRANRDIVDLRARYRKETLDDSALTRSLLDQNAEKMQTAEKLLRNAETRSPGTRSEVDELVPTYKLTRVTPSGTVTWMASEDALLEPGDVLQVGLPRPSPSMAAPAQSMATPATR